MQSTLRIDDSRCEINNVLQDDVEKNNDREVAQEGCAIWSIAGYTENRQRAQLFVHSGELAEQVTLVSLEVCATTSNQKAMRLINNAFFGCSHHQVRSNIESARLAFSQRAHVGTLGEPPSTARALQPSPPAILDCIFVRDTVRDEACVSRGFSKFARVQLHSKVVSVRTLEGLDLSSSIFLVIIQTVRCCIRE